jgi:basic membrane protein A
MRLTKVAAALAAALALASLAACSSSTPSASSTASKPKVAIILGGLANDGGFNEYAADAGKTLQKEGKISLSIRESVTTATDSEPIMRQYAEQGYNLIIGWGLDFSRWRSRSRKPTSWRPVAKTSSSKPPRM